MAMEVCYMAVQGDRYATVDASVVDLPINSLGNASFGGPVGDGQSVLITAYWSYDPETDSGGFSGVSWFGSSNNSPVTGQQDSAINTYLTQLYDSTATEGGDAVAAVTNYVNNTLFDGWTQAELTGLINEYLSGAISAPGCFRLG